MKTVQTQVIVNIQQAQPTIEALEKIDPLALILRVLCVKCGSIFGHDAEYLLRMTRTHGYFRPSKLCPSCRTSRLTKKKKAKPPAEVKSTKTKKQIKKNIKPVAKKPRTSLVRTTSNGNGFHQPFKSILAGVKIEPEG